MNNSFTPAYPFMSRSNSMANIPISHRSEFYRMQQHGASSSVLVSPLETIHNFPQNHLLSQVQAPLYYGNWPANQPVVPLPLHPDYRQYPATYSSAPYYAPLPALQIEGSAPSLGHAQQSTASSLQTPSQPTKRKRAAPGPQPPPAPGSRNQKSASNNTTASSRPSKRQKATHIKSKLSISHVPETLDSMGSNTDSTNASTPRAFAQIASPHVQNCNGRPSSSLSQSSDALQSTVPTNTAQRATTPAPSRRRTQSQRRKSTLSRSHTPEIIDLTTDPEPIESVASTIPDVLLDAQAANQESDMDALESWAPHILGFQLPEANFMAPHKWLTLEQERSLAYAAKTRPVDRPTSPNMVNIPLGNVLALPKTDRTIEFGTEDENGRRKPLTLEACLRGSAEMKDPQELVFRKLPPDACFIFNVTWLGQKINFMCEIPVKAEEGREMTKMHLAFIIAITYCQLIDAVLKSDNPLPCHKAFESTKLGKGGVTIDRVKIMDIRMDENTGIWHPSIDVECPYDSIFTDEDQDAAQRLIE